jgi:hypothetical protein
VQIDIDPRRGPFWLIRWFGLFECVPTAIR